MFFGIVKRFKADLAPYVSAAGSGALAVFLFHRGFHLLISHRIQRRLLKVPIIGPLTAKILWYWTSMVTGSELSYYANIGLGVYFPHPIGVVIGEAVIEENVTILQGVTIGKKHRGNSSGIRICEGAFIGAGAKVIGDLIIGKNSVIGANSVVLKDVPDGALALGIPAEIKIVKS